MNKREIQERIDIMYNNLNISYEKLQRGEIYKEDYDKLEKDVKDRVKELRKEL